MKRTIILLIVFSYLVPQNLKAQDNAATIAAVAGGVVAIGAGIAAVEFLFVLP